MRSQSVSSEASISSISSRSSCSSSSGSSTSGTERNAMTLSAAPAAITAAPAINFLELRLVAAMRASLLNLNSTIFSLVSTEVSVVSVMSGSFQIEGSHIRVSFLRENLYPKLMGYGGRLESGVDGVLFHLFPALNLVQLFLQDPIVASKQVNSTLERVGLMLLLVISNPVEKGEQGSNCKCDVEHGLSFRRSSIYGRKISRKAYTPWWGIELLLLELMLEVGDPEEVLFLQVPETVDNTLIALRLILEQLDLLLEDLVVAASDIRFLPGVTKRQRED
nr:MAG TPA: hypothetical protein [Caudoviricetes sp.]